MFFYMIFFSIVYNKIIIVIMFFIRLKVVEKIKVKGKKMEMGGFCYVGLLF